MPIRKGQTIHNDNGHKYEVLATKHNRYKTQNLLLRDKKTNQIIIARDWRPNNKRKQNVGTWGNGQYYGNNVSKIDFIRIYRTFRKKDY